MKLLMISGDRWILQGKKGAFWYTLEEFSKHWERIDVITPYARNSELGTRNPFPNVFFHPSPYSLLFQSKWIMEKGKQLIAEHHHDVMTSHEYPPFYNGVGVCHLHRATGVPYMLEVHHIVGWPKAASFFEWIGRVTSRWQIPKSAYHASVVRVVNAEVQQQLIQWGIPAQKVSVIPSFYMDAQKLRKDSSIAKTYDLVFCARLVANKGLDDVLRAVQSLPGVTLLIIGDGPEKTSAEALAVSLGIRDRVTFRGWLSTQEDVIREMQSAKIFVMHSTSEGGPRVALEAMACGMPVITTGVGVMPEVIQDGVNGVFTNGTLDRLKEKITMLLSESAQRDAMGTEAMKITEKFERKALVKNYADALKSLPVRS